MAGGKMTPRQKLVSLMYLVFLAMMAMSTGKEILTAFGTLNETLTKNNKLTNSKNEEAYSFLETKVADQPLKYAPLNKKAKKIKKLSKELYNYIESIKKDALGDKVATEYETMDKGDFLNEKWFKGDGETEAAKEFVKKINTYRDVVAKETEGRAISSSVVKMFDTKDVTDSANETKKWLTYHYEGTPLIASLTKLTQLQSYIKTTESETLSQLLGEQTKIDSSVKQLKGIVSLDKSAFYPGEKVTGKVVLGKYDATLQPSRVELNSNKDYKNFEDGAVIVEETAGSVGDKPIEGTIFFMEEGKEVSIPFKSSYSVIPKPNGAVISADKMNVVYRGLKNPMTISIPGISSINASGSGLSKISGNKYNMTPRSGSTVSITVSGKTTSGATVKDTKRFRIKDLPPAVCMVRGKYGSISLPKSSVQGLTIGAGMPDFLFDMNLAVTSFKVKVTGKPTVVVNGSRMSSKAKQAIAGTRRGQSINIFDVKARVTNYPGAKVRKVLGLLIKVNN